ncbi:hypothetical protein MKQ68_04620 [Chitinophaga horti]|uniref:DUF5018 domain-containing protein n=1 Tax=Chitinophaga horti TaxID=2920382 RepID=A0ABY6J6Z8_9BACT|nr:hypothetical protein [Chitinophaga horti]UYQ94372.1 hypothetical protein MKQ68_04620 [Chitinophaga horti]
MKPVLLVIMLIVLFLATLMIGCRDHNTLTYTKDFKSFYLSAARNNGLTQDVQGEINDTMIILRVPNMVDVSKLIPAFDLVNPRTIIKVNGVVQESGVTVVDFTEPVIYSVKAEDRTVKTWKVKVEKSAAITKFGFYENDNPGVIFKDYVAVITGVNINVYVPRETDLTNLAPRFEFSSGATVKVNGVLQESRRNQHNFTNPVAYEVLEAGAVTGDQFIVKVNYLTDPLWVKIGENIIGPRTDGLVMGINPVTDKPLLAYQRDGSENGVAIDGAEEKVAVIAYTGTGWEYYGGAAGFSEDKAEDFALAFDDAGTPFVSFKDFKNSEQRATVMKYVNNNWSTVGVARFSVPRPDYLSMTIGAGNVPFISMSARGGTVVAERGLYPMSFDGAAWNAANPPAGITCGTTHMTTRNGKVYMGILERTGGASKPSVYTWDNGTWRNIGNPQFSANGNNGFLKVELAVDPAGEVYAAYQEPATVGRLNHVMHYTGSAWELLGTSVNVAGERDNFNIAVHPNGKLYLAYSDGNALFVKTFNKQINNWDPAVRVINTRVSEFDMQVANDGVVYLAAALYATEKTEVWKLDIP